MYSEAIAPYSDAAGGTLKDALQCGTSIFPDTIAGIGKNCRMQLVVSRKEQGKTCDTHTISPRLAKTNNFYNKQPGQYVDMKKQQM